MNNCKSLVNKYDIITIVSGLPRSGTSMMMRMLEAGNMPVLVDNLRKPDDDNPKGYYEYEPVKKIKEDASWLENARGKAVKMVSLLLYHLPPDRYYKIIFMRRKMNEILASQRVMLERLGQIQPANESGVSDEEMAQKFEEHLKKINSWLSGQENIDVLYVDYSTIIMKPQEQADNIVRFLGVNLDPEKMIKTIDKKLYRQRSNI
ncbi:MAG: sulfotransferase family protein [Candidatus Latescibacteria bacterium]|jgi:hypothetical protein|nr:sulfotransferase family protein [Candidatus Latescibacterota bacterium]